MAATRQGAVDERREATALPVVHDGPAAPSGAHEVTAFVVIGLLGIALLALAIGLLFLPPGVSFALIRRGLGEDKLSWVVMGAVVALMWLVMLYVTARKFLQREHAAVDRE